MLKIKFEGEQNSSTTAYLLHLVSVPIVFAYTQGKELKIGLNNSFFNDRRKQFEFKMDIQR